MAFYNRAYCQMESRKISVAALIVPVLVLSVLSAGCGKSPRQKEAAFLERGKKQLQNKDYQRAIIEFRNAAQVNPKDAEPLYQLGLAFWSIQGYREAYTALKK